ncbi:MAG TPA: C39 family peptidase [Ktedonobacteraceae bacterium]|jgi:uncharacterized protein YvpB
MKYPIFSQRNSSWSNEELGTGQGITIGGYGCTLTCVASLLVYFGKNTDPHQLNQDLIRIKGYANNGNGNYDLIIWSAITKLYPDVILVFNNLYPNNPADMSLIDRQLHKDIPVVVGVSFNHLPADTSPSHYVVLYQKNLNESYQAMDPWTGSLINFNQNYAVNGMSVAQCILQASSYNGPVPRQKMPSIFAVFWSKLVENRPTL